MRVLYLLRYYPTLTETFVYREIDGVVGAGIGVVVASLGARSDGVLNDELPAAPVVTIPRRPWRGRLGTRSVGTAWLSEVQRPKDAARLSWLAGEVARLGIDRVHVHFAGEAAEVARALWLDTGLPYSITVHAADLFKPRPSLSAVLADADAVLTVANHHADRLAGMGVSARVVRCGPDLAAFRPAALPGGPLRAAFVGRDVPKKGLDLLLDAWHAHDGATLEVVSDRAGPAPLGVRLHGLLPPRGVRAVLASVNLLVLPCRRARDGDLDGVPVALMEAMAMGRPVLTTPVSGIPELVDSAVGWLVPPDDVSALREALRAATPDERARRGAAGPGRLVERGYTAAAQAAGVVAVWAKRDEG